jgi:hypothetical protein
MHELVTRQAAIGIRAREDLESIAELDGELIETPEIGAVVTVARLDLDDLEKALEVRAELLRTEAELANMPDLRHEDPDRLAIAANLMRATASSEFLESSPGQAYAAASDEISTLQDLVETIEGVLPALDVLKLGATVIPASRLLAAASAAYIAGMTPGRHWHWARSLPEAKALAVAATEPRWRSLLDAEATWTAKLSGYGPDARPSPDEVDTAAATLGKRGVAKVFAAVTGSARYARTLANQIGFKVESASDLSMLAEHIRSVAAFESDADLKLLFGAAWRGLDTPVNDIRQGVEIRDFLRDTVLSQHGGEAIVERVLALTDEDFAALIPLAAACKRLLALSPGMQEKLDDTPVDTVLANARSKCAELRDFLAVDPNRLLSGIDAPIRRIAHAYALLSRCARIRTTLAGHPTATAASSLGSSEARRAIGWVRSIRASRLNHEVKELLLSHRAGEVRRANQPSGWRMV